jgi:hypothetical protein
MNAARHVRRPVVTSCGTPSRRRAPSPITAMLPERHRLTWSCVVRGGDPQPVVQLLQLGAHLYAQFASRSTVSPTGRLWLHARAPDPSATLALAAELSRPVAASATRGPAGAHPGTALQVLARVLHSFRPNARFLATVMW